MIIVDSSVWIDFFNGQASPAALKLKDLLGVQVIATGDLMLAEVLQGFREDRAFEQAKVIFATVPILDVGGQHVAIRAAENFRVLRKQGITVRKTIDCLIATYCIEHGHSLLFSDRDFMPFVEKLGLQVV
ncbi:MAG: PIN domain nuclease [Gammaproteobacteria bacterium]|nr:PIN domain nuclease [Gammaproteobacteria bacterium]